MSPREENTFDSNLEYIIDEFLSANNDIREMLVANQILTYWCFTQLDKEDVYSLERVKTTGAATKLRNHHAERVSEILEYVWFLQDNDDYILADNPFKWDIKDLCKWKRDGKPMGDPKKNIRNNSAT